MELTKEQLIAGAERLKALAEGKKLQVDAGKWMDEQIGVLHTISWLCGDKCRIAPDLPPKPTPEQLAAWGKVIDGDQPREVRRGDQYAAMDGGRSCVPEIAENNGETNGKLYGGLRWILKDEPKPDPKVIPWTRETCPVGKVVVDKDGARCQIHEACLLHMLYGNGRTCFYTYALGSMKMDDGSPCGTVQA